MTRSDALARAALSLDGLSVGDAFGETNLARVAATFDRIAKRLITTRRPWKWTDDTAMALSIVDELARRGAIDPAALGDAFVRRYALDPARGYGRGAHEVLAAIATGTPYDRAARALFDGQGSRGNGGGMRAAPIGAYFAGDLDAAVAQAICSAAPTHAHPDGIAGAVAVAVAAAAVFAGERDPRAILELVVARTPSGATGTGVQRSIAMLRDEPIAVAAELGNGSRVLSADTVPFAIWCAVTHLADYAAALWACGSVGGDIDTTCAMVGGIVVGAVGVTGIPADWHTARERLPT
jgi:ADP-ribosylglycohydrolase